MANKADTDQTAPQEQSDLSLHCLSFCTDICLSISIRAFESNYGNQWRGKSTKSLSIKFLSGLSEKTTGELIL